MNNYQNMVNAFSHALRRSQKWRKDTISFASYVPMLLGQAIGCPENVYVHHIEEPREQKGNNPTHKILVFEDESWIFGVGIELMLDDLKRISIKIRTRYMGGLVVSIADEDNTFMYGEDNDAFFERISDRVMGRLNNDNEITDKTDLLLIGY